MTLCDLAVHVARELALQLGVDELLLQNKQGLAKAVVDDKALENVL